MRRRTALAVSLWVTAAPTLAQAPDAAAPHAVEIFEEAISVRVVNLEAVVTDRKGRRVPGLSAEDFRLRVDGAQTPLTYFAEMDGQTGKREGAAGETEPPVASGPNLVTSRSPALSWQSRNILVFLDEATMLKARRNTVLHAMTRQLGRLVPGDRMAIVAFDGSRLEVLSDWTGDRARLVSVLAAVKRRPANGIRQEVSRREDASDEAFSDAVTGAVRRQEARNDAAGLGISDVSPFGTTGTLTSARVPRSSIGSGASSASRQTSSHPFPTQLFNPLDRLLEAGQAAAAAMRAVPAPSGRKMLMLLTEGFPEPVFARPVVEEANRLGYSLYPVDVRGLDTFRAANDVEQTAPAATELISTARDRRSNFTLEAMAAATGGKAAVDSERMAALENLVEDSASYYLLGFSPVWRGDDRRHRMVLTLNRPGLAVRSQTHYIDASRQTRLSLEADAALLLGRSPSTQRLILTVDQSRSGSEATTIFLSLGIPVESLAFFATANGFRAQAPVAMVALDDQGRRLELPGTWVQVDVAQPPLQGTYARIDFEVPVKSKARRLVVTVHDALSGEALWAEARFDPRQKGDANKRTSPSE